MKNNFWTNVFGLSSGKNDNLMKMLTAQHNQFWGNTKPTWIDTNKPYELYIQIPELRTVINKRALMMSGGVPKVCDLEGNPIDSHWVKDLIMNPNPTQSWSDVVYSLAVNDGLFNNSFAYCPKRSFDIRNLFVPLPSNKIKIVGTGKYLDQLDTDGLIKEFQFWYDTQKKDIIQVEDMVYLNTPDGINLLNPVNRIDTLKYPLSNIMAQYNKRNVILENMGAIGILSSKKSDMGGALPMTPEEREEIQADWLRRSKDKLVMTEADVDWTPMSYPTKDLMLFEELTEDKMAIIDAYGLSYYLFSQSNGATFTNVKEGMRMSYQDTIIPETKQMYATISQQLGLIEEGLYIKPDFSHIPVLQDDKNQEASTVVSLVQNGVIDPNEARNVLGYSEREEQERSIQALNGAQVTSMVQVAESVATGMLSPTSAIEILIISFGISREQAESIVNNIGEAPSNS
tara:strand:- start:11191 stop:12561 length:1371 start_codon:yes stop_codon:yes gene_type:complete